MPEITDQKRVGAHIKLDPDVRIGIRIVHAKTGESISDVANRLMRGGLEREPIVPTDS